MLRKILLVDSDCDFLDRMAEALKREGFSLVTARDGQQALHRWQADQPDLVVLEVNLPGVSGLDVCRQIRATDSTPIIFLSDQTAEEQITQSFGVGADDYIAKPVSPQELALRIRATWRYVTGTEGN